MADREAKVRLVTEIVDAEKSAEQIGKINAELKQGGEVAQTTAAALSETAAATGELSGIQEQASETAAQLASATATAGEAATAAGQQTASAASGSVEAIEQVVDASGRQSEAAAGAGRSADKAGDETVAAANQSAHALEQVVAQWADAQIAAQKAGVAFDERSTIESVQQLVTAVRNSGASFEDQREALIGVQGGMEQAANALATSSEKGTGAADAQGKAVQKALEVVKAGVKDVSAEIDASAAASDESGRRTAESFIGVADALKIASQSADDTTEKLKDTGRVPKAEIKELAEVIETVQIAMERAAGTQGAVTAEQEAQLEALKVKLGELTEVSNRQTAASTEHAVALREEGDTAAETTIIVSELGKKFGESSQHVAEFVHYVGTLQHPLDELKKRFSALDLNTLGVTKSLTLANGKVQQVGVGFGKLATQAGIIAAVLAAVADAGTKLAASNEQNTDSFERQKKAVEHHVPTLENYKDRVGAVSDGVQRLNTATNGLIFGLAGPLPSSIDQTGDSFDNLTEKTLKSEHSAALMDERTVSFSDSLKRLAVGFYQGKEGADIFAAAQERGFSMEQAWQLAADDTGEVLKFYKQGATGGAEAQQLLNEAWKEGAGDAERLKEFVRKHSEQMERAASIEAQVAEIRKETGSATKEVSETLAHLSENLGSIDWRSAEISVYAHQIAALTANIQNLNEDEKNRLLLIAQLIQKGPDITAAQKELLAVLLEQTATGEKASGVQNTLIRGYLDMGIAVDGTAKKLGEAQEVLRVYSDDWETNRARIKGAIAVYQDALNNTDGLKDAQRAAYQQEIDLARARDAELDRFAQLAAQRTAREVEDENRTRAAIVERIGDLSKLVSASQRYSVAIEAIGGEVADLMGHTTRLSGAERDRLTIITDLSSRASDLTRAEREIAASLLAEVAAGRQATVTMNELVKARIAAAQTGEGLTIAIGGTTAAITENINAVLQLLPQNELHAVQLGKLADLLTQQASSTEGLTKAERDRIEEIVELIKKGDELTLTEKRYIETLAYSIQHGNYQITTLKQLADAEERRKGAIQNEIDALQALIEEKERALGLDKQQAQTSLDAGASLEYLRAKQEQLRREQEVQITVVHASSEAKKDEGLEREKLAEIIDKEAAAAERAATSHQKVVGIIANGRIEISQLSDAEQRNEEVSNGLAAAHGKIAKDAGASLEMMRELQNTMPDTTRTLSDHAEEVTRAAEAHERLAKAIRSVNEAAAEATAGATVN